MAKPKASKKTGEESQGTSSLIKTLTFGLGSAYGYDPKAKGSPLTEMTDDQRKAVYGGLIDVSKMIGAVCNILNAQEYIHKIMEIPEKYAKKFKPNYSPIIKRLEEGEKAYHLNIASGSVLSQTFALGVKADFAGEHGKELLTKGTRQLPLHRTDGTHPVFQRAAETKLFCIDKQHYLALQIFAMKWAKEIGLPSGWIAFRIKVKPRDQTMARQLERIEKGEWALKNSRVMRNSRKKGAIWNGQVVVGYTPAPLPKMNTKTVMGVDMGLNVPACVHIREDGHPQGWARMVGRGRELLNNRGMVKQEIIRINRALKSKDSPITNEYRDELRWKLRDLRKRERRVMKTASQKIAAAVADIARRNGAGTWQLEDLSKDIKDEEPWLARNWAPGMLLDAIRWQAKQLGAELVMVDPRNTSRRCASCGHIAKENRPKGKAGTSIFKCVKCGHEDDADKNAAKNLSIEGIDKIIAEAATQD